MAKLPRRRNDVADFAADQVNSSSRSLYSLKAFTAIF